MNESRRKKLGGGFEGLQRRLQAVGGRATYTGVDADTGAAELQAFARSCWEQGRAFVQHFGKGLPAAATWTLAEMASVEIRKVARCPGKGCSACCHQEEIPVTRAEGLEVGRALDEAGWSRALAWKEGAPCPALDPVSNGCSVYAVRPAVCRSYYVASDPAECAKPDGKVGTYMGPGVGIAAFIEGAGEEMRPMAPSLHDAAARRAAARESGGSTSSSASAPSPGTAAPTAPAVAPTGTKP